MKFYICKHCGKIIAVVNERAVPTICCGEKMEELVETKNGNQRKVLKPGDAPVADFAILPGDEVINCLAYCNLHGLWKA